MSVRKYKKEFYNATMIRRHESKMILQNLKYLIEIKKAIF